MLEEDQISKIIKIQHAISLDDAVFLYKNASLNLLQYIGDEIRMNKHRENKVGWIAERNINLTNVCFTSCLFCNFHVAANSLEAYITTVDEYRIKIDELFKIGGRQILLQGGMHPKLGLDFYVDLFRKLKNIYPQLVIHALGPPEIHWLATKEKTDYRFILNSLKEAGLGSLPGAGAEILSDRVRNIVSKNKCTTEQWLAVMREAHKLNLPTSATMMFGHIETPEERIKHLFYIKELQEERPENAFGFMSFIPWPIWANNTTLKAQYPNYNYKISISEYLRLIAISRIILTNIPTIQASWLTVGKEAGQISLHSGANDFGSIMMEENVVSAAGANHAFNITQIVDAIIESGFIPFQRNGKYQELT